VFKREATRKDFFRVRDGEIASQRLILSIIVDEISFFIVISIVADERTVCIERGRRCMSMTVTPKRERCFQVRRKRRRGENEG
jgi:hypothetical protein